MTDNIEWIKGSSYTGKGAETAEAWSLYNRDDWTTPQLHWLLTQKRWPDAAELEWVFTPLGLNPPGHYIIGPVDDYTAEEAKKAAHVIYVLGMDMRRPA